ncbi:Transcription elongation factor S-II [Yarrowia sp. C11]|nr:Transcription elongation factor S-II [Yarrowia sp. E02]KAG5371936.1 Transcription elongation factor S-II [Yarrowia sp. C11]
MGLSVAEIKKLMADLEKASGEAVYDILQVLHKEVAPTEKLLRETKLGIAVNKLRTSGDSRISELVKKMIKSWKDTVTAQKRDAAKKVEAKKDSKDEKSTKSSSSSSATSSSGNATSYTPPSGQRTPAKDGVSTEIYSDKVRNRCIDVTYTALAVGMDAHPNEVLACAKAIENEVYKMENGTSNNYRPKMRSLYINLKDPKNPGLRGNVISGKISAERLCRMSPQEMASDELKKEIEEMEKQNLFAARGATEQRAVTDRFTCGKCKQKKVSYYQMQTRSADEPLTTFCTCENCGTRWKFS